MRKHKGGGERVSNVDNASVYQLYRREPKLQAQSRREISPKTYKRCRLKVFDIWDRERDRKASRVGKKGHSGNTQRTGAQRLQGGETSRKAPTIRRKKWAHQINEKRADSELRGVATNNEKSVRQESGQRAS